MKILTVVQHLGPGGNERVAQNFSIIYQQSGHDVAVLAINKGGIREEILKQNNIELFIGASEGQGRMNAVKQAIAWKPHLVHIHKAGIRDDSIIEILREEIKDQTPFLEKQSFSQISSHNHLIDLNIHQTSWSLWKFKGMAKRNDIKPVPPSVIIPNPSEEKKFFKENKEIYQAFKKELGIPEQSFVYGRIGQPFNGKWNPIIIKAFSEVIQQGKDVFLLLVGAPESITSQVEHLPDSIRKRVILVNYINGDENLRKAYSAIDVFVHAARQGESFGMVLVESMLCETPVITLATPYGDNSQLEVVGHGIGGLVVYSPKKYSSAMLELFDRPDYLSYLAVEGRKRALSMFSLDAVTEKVNLLLYELEKSKSRSDFLNNVQNCPELTSEVKGKEIYNLLKSNHENKKNQVINSLISHPEIYPLMTEIIPKLKEFKNRTYQKLVNTVSKINFN